MAQGGTDPTGKSAFTLEAADYAAGCHWGWVWGGQLGIESESKVLRFSGFGLEVAWQEKQAVTNHSCLRGLTVITCIHVYSWDLWDKLAYPRIGCSDTERTSVVFSWVFEPLGPLRFSPFQLKRKLSRNQLSKGKSMWWSSSSKKCWSSFAAGCVLLILPHPVPHSFKKCDAKFHGPWQIYGRRSAPRLHHTAWFSCP